jgi:NADH-quinone oxidoreductase subunit G
MPDLIIDGLRVTVPEGTTVIEAAAAVGIMIPRLCYHPALGSAGACRMCAVMFTEGPVKGLDMSCMVKARDAMVVDTAHPEAVEFRRHIAELLMIDHPHDCPVCDEGGQCLLQDMVVSCGHSLRTFKGRKRTYRNQELGPLVVQEMNRCIHCYRCARYYQEFAGGRDFGALRISGDVQYGRYAEGPLKSIFAGNLVDVCPTGVFTDKPSRHKARYWDMQRSPSVCLNCSLGCNTVVSARYRSVVRLSPRLNPDVNGHFLCDRGRHGYEYADLPGRPRQALVDGAQATMDTALAAATARLTKIQTAHGPGAVACLGSSRQALESQGMLKHLAAAVGWRTPEYTTGSHRKQNLLSAVAGLGRDLHVSQAEISKSDAILVIGAAPLSEAPMLGLALRQAARQGAAVAVIDPRPVELPLDFLHIPARRHDMEAALGAILRRAFPDSGPDESPESNPEEAAFLEALSPHMPESAATRGWEDFARRLGSARLPVVVCGSDIVRLSTPALAAGAARLLASRLNRAGFFPVLAGANAYGAALMNSDPSVSFDDILDAVERGQVKALVCVESDPLSRFAGHSRVHAALAGLELLVSVDYLPTITNDKSHVFLPSQTVFEAGGGFVNQEGRVQHAHPAFACGLPIDQTLEGGHPSGGHASDLPTDQPVKGAHPPRTYSLVVPGSAPLPSWEILARLGRNLGLDLKEDFDPWQAVATAAPVLAGLAPGVPGVGETGRTGGMVPPDQILVLPETAPGASLQARPSAVPPDMGADLIITEQAFGTEELSSYGTILKSLSPLPQVVLHTLDASTIELRDEEYVHMACGTGEVQCYARMVDNMARSTVVLPRRPDSGWQYATADGYVVELSILSAKPEKTGGGHP